MYDRRYIALVCLEGETQPETAFSRESASEAEECARMWVVSHGYTKPAHIVIYEKISQFIPYA